MNRNGSRCVIDCRRGEGERVGTMGKSERVDESRSERQGTSWQDRLIEGATVLSEAQCSGCWMNHKVGVEDRSLKGQGWLESRSPK